VSENVKKRLSVTSEVIILIILAVGLYLGELKLLVDPISIMGDWPFSTQFFAAVLTFDVIWFVTIRVWPLKNVHVKIILTILVVTFSAAIMTCYIGDYLLRDFRY
jgi:ABC-type phosphate/phosphonate transport system permease subunit